jgi:cation diffusion facilitator family transporter
MTPASWDLKGIPEDDPAESSTGSMKEKIALGSVLANLVLATVKIAAGILAHSASVLAEGIHSGIDILASGISLVGIKTAEKPRDQEHPYGHHKFEVLGGLFITGILFLTGLWIVAQAVRRFSRPEPLRFTALALATMAFSAVVNGLMARLKTHYGKIENSISLLSDGVHSRIDVYTSVAVLAGIVLARFWVRADTFLALAIGLYIIKESLSLGRASADSLLDASAGEDVEKRIEEIVAGRGVVFSDLRTQKKGAALTANMKIAFPGAMKIEQATVLADELKRALMDGIPRLEYVALQIESHDLASASYQPVGRVTGRRHGEGSRWQGHGASRGAGSEAIDSGLGGFCFCQKCGYRLQHTRGAPCSTLNCPGCGTPLRRG